MRLMYGPVKVKRPRVGARAIGATAASATSGFTMS
jgi:hypothetical protein